MTKKGIRVRITFTKRDGREAEFWTAAPEGYDHMGPEEQKAWASRTAFRRHQGAQNATVTGRG